MWTDRRAITIGLAVSLLLNVFLLGLMGGRMSSARHPAPKAPAAGPVILPGHVNALPPEEKASFQAVMASHRPAIRAARRELRAARATVEQDIAAPTYDRDKVTADFAALRQAATAVQQAVNEGVIDALGGLSAPSRAALVTRPGVESSAP